MDNYTRDVLLILELGALMSCAGRDGRAGHGTREYRKIRPTVRGLKGLISNLLRWIPSDLAFYTPFPVPQSKEVSLLGYYIHFTT